MVILKPAFDTLNEGHMFSLALKFSKKLYISSTIVIEKYKKRIK